MICRTWLAVVSGGTRREDEVTRDPLVRETARDEGRDFPLTYRQCFASGPVDILDHVVPRSATILHAWQVRRYL